MSDLMMENFPPMTIGEYVDTILEFGIKHGVSDFHFLSHSPLKVDIHGRFHVITPRILNHQEVLNYMKHIYRGDSVETKLNSGQTVDKAHTVKIDGKKFRFRVNAVACQEAGTIGVQITIRTLSEEPPSIKELGVEDEIWNNFTPEQGIILVTGPTGSGKSTLLAACIREIISTPNLNKKIVTYEAPIEYVYDMYKNDTAMITQTEVPTHIQSFEIAIEAALRRKPDIILVGESRDRATIEASINASQTGHLVYTTAHTNGVAATIRRLLSVYEQEERNEKKAALIDSIHMIVTQRLVKTLDGKRKPIKEYLVFDKEVKDRLYNVVPEKMSQELSQILIDRRTNMAESALKLFKSELISKEQLETIKESYK